ncbi:MAG: HEAT repeat domain-containing protein [Candidatus Brocadiaceae bacterium]|jgi:HEAT repeat protein
MRTQRQQAPTGLHRPGVLAVVLLAVAVLAGCAKPEDPQYYVDLLASEKAETRRRAVDELVRMQEKAMPAVRGALESDDVTTRKEALKVLADVRRMDSLRLAGLLLNDPDKGVRLQAIKTISSLSTVWKEKTIELLSQALEDRDAECVRTAAEGLKDMRYEDATAVLRQTYETGEGRQAVYAARYLHELEPSEEIARFVLENLLSPRKALRDAADVCVYGIRKEDKPEEFKTKGLQDEVIGTLVAFADEHAANAYVREVLGKVRDALIEELERTLDTKRAAEILYALGVMADEASIQKLTEDMKDTRLESSWRVSAAAGLGLAARSPRAGIASRRTIIDELSKVLADEGVDNRVRIGAAIALCRLRQRNGVQYLLNELDRFQETVGEGTKLSESELQSLTELRIRAQEALTASGDYVVEFLRRRATSRDAGPIIIWAAAKTFGELGVEDAVAFLGRVLTQRKTPEIRVGPEGRLSKPVELEDWEKPDEEEVAEWQQKLEVFARPDYVRWAAAMALGQIGGKEAENLLREAADAEQELLEHLRRNRDSHEVRTYHLREPVIEGVMRKHEDVLFYIRLALDQLGSG